MSEVRLNFLNYNPDAEDVENPGLSVADNVVHDSEGYKPIYLRTGGAFATTGGLAASTATITCLVAKPIGSQDDLLCAWMASDTLHVGVNGVTSASVTTGYPLSFTTAGAQAIFSFDVCEYAGKVFFVVEARQTQGSPSTTATLRHCGYLDF